MDNKPDYASVEVPELIHRLIQLREVLLAQPQTFPAICQQLPNYYHPNQTGQRAFRRDCHSLRALGYQIEITSKPKRWHIVANHTVIDDNDLEALVAIRDLVGFGHPITLKVKQLLDRLTKNLSPQQQYRWQQNPAIRVAFNPAIDYSPYTKWISFFENAIQRRQQVGFYYQALKHDQPQLYPRLDPYEVEYRDRHYYLVAYCYRYGRVLTFRLDRMIYNQAEKLPQLLPDMQQLHRKRPKIRFTYRLPASFAAQGVSERFTIEDVRIIGNHVEIDASEFSEFQIVRILLGYGEHAKLIKGPPSLFLELRRVTSAMYTTYATSTALELGE